MCKPASVFNVSDMLWPIRGSCNRLTQLLLLAVRRTWIELCTDRKGRSGQVDSGLVCRQPDIRVRGERLRCGANFDLRRRLRAAQRGRRLSGQCKVARQALRPDAALIGPLPDHVSAGPRRRRHRLHWHRARPAHLGPNRAVLRKAFPAQFDAAHWWLGHRRTSTDRRPLRL